MAIEITIHKYDNQGKAKQLRRFPFQEDEHVFTTEPAPFDVISLELFPGEENLRIGYPKLPGHPNAVLSVNGSEVVLVHGSVLRASRTKE